MSKYIKEGLNALRETRAGGPLLPVNTQMARRGVKGVYNPIRDTGGPNQAKRAVPDVDDPNVTAAARVKRVGKSTNPLDQQQINLRVSPKTVKDTVRVAGGGAGVGAAVLAKDALDKRRQQAEQNQVTAGVPVLTSNDRGNLRPGQRDPNARYVTGNLKPVELPDGQGTVYGYEDLDSFRSSYNDYQTQNRKFPGDFATRGVRAKVSSPVNKFVSKGFDKLRNYYSKTLNANPSSFKRL